MCLAISQTNFLVVVGSLGNLAALKTLDLSFQALSGEVPSNLAASPVLQTLSLVYNNLSSGVPDSIGASQSLVTVDLSYNNFTEWLSPFSGMAFLPPSWMKTKEGYDVTTDI